jgi:nucleoside-diphosphate-sugar epimerase
VISTSPSAQRRHQHGSHSAHFRFAGPRAPYFQTNVDGTTALIKASGTAGAKTFVYVSTAGIIMDDRGSPVHDADESGPTHPNSFSAYLASKAQGICRGIGTRRLRHQQTFDDLGRAAGLG